MQDQLAHTYRPHVLLEPFRPTSIFLCPCRVSPGKLKELVTYAKTATQVDKSELLKIRLDPFEEQCLGLYVKIQPQLLFCQVWSG